MYAPLIFRAHNISRHLDSFKMAARDAYSKTPFDPSQSARKTGYLSAPNEQENAPPQFNHYSQPQKPTELNHMRGSSIHSINYQLGQTLKFMTCCLLKIKMARRDAYSKATSAAVQTCEGRRFLILGFTLRWGTREKISGEVFLLPIICSILQTKKAFEETN